METMRTHHQATLDAASTHFRSDPNVLALILGGSVVKGTAKDTSDVDVMVVLKPEAFQQRRQNKSYAQVIWDLATYEGGYVDTKYIDQAFLEAAAIKASEPTRDSFTSAKVIWSDIPGLDSLLEAIPVYPEAERESKIKRFYSACLVQTFFIGEAESRQDPFLANYASSNMVLFAARLILAYNRMLFPSNKRLMERVATAPDQPDGFTECLQNLLREPSPANGQSLKNMLNSFRDWGIDWGTALGQYTEDSEFNWLDNPPPLAES
jgi:predicted nucleotidyltransferase